MSDIDLTAAQQAAHDAAVARWVTGSSDTTQMLLAVGAGLHAAVPLIEAAVREKVAATVEAVADRKHRESIAGDRDFDSALVHAGQVDGLASAARIARNGAPA